MEDKPASPQIIDLFEATRDALFNTTSKGEVPAPNSGTTTRDAAIERAAVVKYLRRVAVGQPSDAHRLLFDITYAIEQGEHL